MRSYEHYETIAVTREGRILTITMNRPEVLNATNAVLHKELSEIFYDVNLDEDADIIIFTGAGRAFSAGGDTAWMQTMIDESQQHVNGKVRVKLYKGGVYIAGRQSDDDSLFDERIATFEEDDGAYDQADAEGFIKLNALRLRIGAKRRNRG